MEVKVKLASLHNPKIIRLGCDLKTKDAVIDLLVDDIFRFVQPPVKKEIVHDRIYEREGVGSTVFDNGFSLPHARIDNFPDIIIAIAVMEKPIISEDKEIKMLTLVLTSNTDSGIYLNILSAFSKVVVNKALYEKLLIMKDVREFIQTLWDENILVKKVVTVEDIMAKDIISILPNATVRELTDMMFKNKKGYIPVVDEKGKFVGEVNVVDIIGLGIPQYAQTMSNLKFLNTLEPFDEMLKCDKDHKVSEIMSKPTIMLEPTNSAVAAAFELYNQDRRVIPVVENGDLRGLISYMDILTKILRV